MRRATEAKKALKGTQALLVRRESPAPALVQVQAAVVELDRR